MVLSDLRGYGDAGKPLPIAGEPAHTAASKRSMALDQVTMMDALGHASFALVGHALSCGHYIPEEVPDELLAQITDFIPDKPPTNQEQP